MNKDNQNLYETQTKKPVNAEGYVVGVTDKLKRCLKRSTHVTH